jgi:hypothetical protein
MARMTGGASLVLTLSGIVWNHPIKRWHVFLAGFMCYFLASFRVWQKEYWRRQRCEPIVVGILERFESRSAYLVKKYIEVRDQFGNRGQGEVTDGLEKNLTKPFRKARFVKPYDYWGFTLHGLWLLILELKEDIEKFNATSRQPLKVPTVENETDLSDVLSTLGQIQSETNSVTQTFHS